LLPLVSDGWIMRTVIGTLTDTYSGCGIIIIPVSPQTCFFISRGHIERLAL
jgi:hypothetical protein